jgi:hypothetical protein
MLTPPSCSDLNFFRSYSSPGSFDDPDLKELLEWAFVSNPDLSKECWCWSSFYSKNDTSRPGGNAGALR